MKALSAVSDIVAELEQAERKFPGFPTDPVHAAAIIVEEAGELQQAALQFTYEGGGFDCLYKEAVQTGAMALRFLLNIGAMKMRPSELVERCKTAPNRASTKRRLTRGRGL
jgi:hypothetical protein